MGFLVRATAKQEEEIETAARAVLLDDEEIVRIRREAELSKAGSGWRAVVEATTAREIKMRAAAWVVLLDDKEIVCIRRDAELRNTGSGWGGRCRSHR